MIRLTLPLFAILTVIPIVSCHIAFYHPSMYGFNVTAKTFPRDYRPHVPLDHENFKDWWFHGHLDYPPNDGDVFELPAGGTAVGELACHKAATSYFASSESHTDIRQGNYPCPGEPLKQFHTTGLDDVTGCALAIVDKSNVNHIQPEDFAVFSVNHVCVWTKDTEFKVPSRMPACTDGVCHCAWFWIHSSNSGSQQMYMNGFKCKVTNTDESARKIGKPSLARRCHDPVQGFDEKNCTQGAKQPLYWFQKERNTFFEGTFSPPLYNDLYDFKDGAQEDIFSDEPGKWEDSNSATIVPQPVIISTTAVSAVISPTPVSTSTTSVVSQKSASASTISAVSQTSASISSAAPLSSTSPGSLGTQSDDKTGSNGLLDNTSGIKQESNQGALVDQSKGTYRCVRRTPEMKRKRAMERAAQAAHNNRTKRFGTGLRSLFGGF